MNYLYYNENNDLRCNARKIETSVFSSFNNSIIELLSGKYLIAIDISANLSESFYDAIDRSTDTFTDSPFSIFIKIGTSIQSFTIGQYTPVNIHVTRFVEVDKPEKVSITSNSQDLKNINIHITTERL